MKLLSVLFVLLLVGCSSSQSEWKDLFDGKTLSGWDGDPKFWSVQDGAITGTTTAENPTKGNTFIIFTDANGDNKPVQFSDFEIKIEYRIPSGNSGLQYRSFHREGGADRWRIAGYQADYDAAMGWAGTNYGEGFRGILAKRGESVVITGTTKNAKGRVSPIREVTAIADAKELQKSIKAAPEWNELHVIAKGNVLIQKINGVLMSKLVDNDKNKRLSGLIAIQLHQGPPMKMQVRSVKIKELK